MSVRKERRIKEAMRPIINEVKAYVETKKETLGLPKGVRLKVGANYDKIKKETQLIFTFIGKQVNTVTSATEIP